MRPATVQSLETRPEAEPLQVAEATPEAPTAAPAATALPLKVWTQDESRFGLLSVLRRVLTLRGVKPVARFRMVFAYFYLYGVVDPLTGESFLLELPALNTDCFQLFLDAFAQAFAQSLNILVLDNGRFHTTPKLRLPPNVRLVTTPPYTPEVNPIERLWQDIKARLRAKSYATLEELSAALSEIIKQYTPAQLRSLTSYPFFKQACDAVCSA